MAQAFAQSPYPDLTIQDVTWNSGTHHYAVTQKIQSPSTAALPVLIRGTADAEFVSGTEVRLRPGFHAGGFATNGRFRAYIDQGLGAPGDVVIISPNVAGTDPYGSLVDNVIHVNKWEKVEVGLRLPQEYRDAIDSFFAHYYPYPSTSPNANVAVTNNLDDLHDLNPYADDSLQVVMTLRRPDGSQTMKWGFFMREAQWDPDAAVADEALLVNNDTSALVPFNVRFRFAPDQVGQWHISFSVKAPHTNTLLGSPLPDLALSGYALICDPPLSDNKGPLSINQNNHRNLQFEGDANDPDDNVQFIGIGPNLGHHRLDIPDNYHEFKLHRRDFRLMTESMGLLHSVGANFVRSYLLNLSFAPEMVNLGVYDAFKVPQICDLTYQSMCGNGGWMTDILGNCQYQCWAFDRFLDSAHENGIYIQLCVDPYPPVLDYERFLWGTHPHVADYLEPYRDTPANGNPWDLKRFFYSNEDPNLTDSPRLYDEGAFYYWKRKYKYIMSRWGYSVNIPIIEPFNEIDQMLSYNDQTLTPDLNALDPCANNGALCEENRVEWVQDPTLRSRISDWFSDIANYVRGEPDWDRPAYSPLGEKNKLFLASFAGGDAAMDNAASYYAPFLNPAVDINDAHKGLHQPWDLNAFSGAVETYRNNFTAGGVKKPFNSGEFTHYLHLDYNGKDHDVSPYFHNYEIAFHNEIWAGAFSGRFATGTTWQWGRVFWWPDSQLAPPPDINNDFQSSHPLYQFDNRPGEWNRLQVNNGNYWIQNRSVAHNFKPLTDLLNHPSWLAYDFFSRDYKVRRNEDFTDLEAYYLQNITANGLSTVAIGWVRNRNSSIFNSYYLASNEQQFLSCTAPNPATSGSIHLDMFEPGVYHVSWFPTRMNSSVHPPDSLVYTSTIGMIELDLQNQFGGIANNYLDTLRGDYAFIITPAPFAKSRPHTPVAEEVHASSDWDFVVYPNPALDGFTLNFQDDLPKEVVILDVSGRLIVQKTRVTTSNHQFSELGLAQGAYCVRVSNGLNSRTKKLIIQ